MSAACPRALRAFPLLARRLTAVAFVGALVMAAMVPARGQDAGAASERGVKAAFVYKFLAYIDWMPGTFARPDQSIVVGVVGADDLAGELADAVRGRTVNGRPVEVRRMRATDPIAGVQLLFVGASDRARIPQLAKAAQARGALLVSESDDALDQGSAINLVVVDGRVRFEVALEAAERAGVKLSSRLLAVAYLVRLGDR